MVLVLELAAAEAALVVPAAAPVRPAVVEHWPVELQVAQVVSVPVSAEVQAALAVAEVFRTGFVRRRCCLSTG